MDENDENRDTRTDGKPPVVREYDIEGTRYIVTATVKPGAVEDAATKVRRLIAREVQGALGRAAS
jgi:hypothetical protein